MKKATFHFFIFILICIMPSFGQNRSNTEDEKRYVDFMIGYNYTPNMPIGFTIGGLTGFYASLNFNFSTVSNGVVTGNSHSNENFTDEKTSDALEFVIGYSFYLNNFIRLPVGVGVSITESNYSNNWHDNEEINTKVILESGLQLNILKYLYLSGTFRTIGFEKNTFSIGAGFIYYSPQVSGTSTKSNASTRTTSTYTTTTSNDIDNTLGLVARDLQNKVDYNNDGLINCIDAAVSFYKWYPDKSKVRIEINRNPVTGMHHLFNFVYINGAWVAVEPQAKFGNHKNFSMQSVWGKEYDEKFNRDATQQYVQYVK